jgi:hypothetical protein
MTARDRNPYVILGIEYGAPRDEANLAFARMARPLKRSKAQEALLNLTWALNQIDEAIKNPELALDIYRIPADKAAFESEGSGIFAPPPEHLSRRESTPDADLATLEATARRELLARVVTAYATTRPLPLP